MSGRPAAHRWEILDETSDPIPGDPEEVAKLGRKLRKTADTIQKQADEIKALSEVDSWKGKAANKFRDNAGDTSGKLRKAFQRYDAAAEALGTHVEEDVCSKEYATELHRAQKLSYLALKSVEDGEKKGPDDDKDAKNTKKDGGEESSDSGTEDPALKKTKEDVETAKSIRDNAAKRAADAIREVIDNDDLKDGFWDEVGEIANNVSKIIGPIASALGVAALVLSWVPVLGQALAVLATIATAISLVANLTKACLGQGSWTDVALDAVGIATVGIGRAAAVGAKSGIRGTKALAHSRIFKSVAKSSQGKTQKPLVEAIKQANKYAPGAEIGGARKQLVQNIPSKPWPSFRESMKGLSPKGMYSDLKDVAKNGPTVSRQSLGDPDVNKAVGGLKDLGKVGLDDAKIRDGMYKTAGHVASWGGATGANFAAGPGNTLGWWDGVKD